LAEIRRRLEALDDHAVQALLEQPGTAAGAPADSAVDYVRAVLGGSSAGPSVRHEPPRSAPAPPVPPSPSPRIGPGPRPATADRAQGERIALTPDIEVHVRRPLSREDNRRLEKLLERGEELFRGGEV
jgi:hypothetical protein